MCQMPAHCMFQSFRSMSDSHACSRIVGGDAGGLDVAGSRVEGAAGGAADDRHPAAGYPG